jgi:hypothetical protein
MTPRPPGYCAPNIEYADPHITQNPITAAYPAKIGFLGGLGSHCCGMEPIVAIGFD